MKTNKLLMAVLLALALGLCGCMKDAPEKQTENETVPPVTANANESKELAHITIHDVHPGNPEDTVEEVFYEDETHVFAFAYPKSNYIIIEYTDGTTQNVKEALADGNITISDLDNHNVRYSIKPKNIKAIIDHAERDCIPTAEALEGFYSDDEYSYYFSSIRSQYVIVYFNDGTQKLIKDALIDGSVQIRDLDCFGISYGMKYLGKDNTDIPEPVPVTINLDLPDDVAAINVKQYHPTNGSTKTALLTSEAEVKKVCSQLESLTLKSMAYVKPSEIAFELSFLNKDSHEIKTVTVSASDPPHISFNAFCCSIESGSLDVKYLESLFQNKNKEISDIKVTFVSPEDWEEPFYEDDVYIYSFGNPQKAYTIVQYTDGSEQKLVDALREGNATIADLDRFKIKYYTNIKPVASPKLSYTFLPSNDYNIPTSLMPMIDAVDLAVVGMYEGTASTYATEQGQIISIGKIGNYRIISGDPSHDPKEISFYGGALPVSKYMQYVSPEISAKHGFDNLTQFEADTKYIGVPSTKYSANPVAGTEYLFLLNYDEATKDYIVACDGYGVREISPDGLGVWNPDTDKFEGFFLENDN